MDENKKQPKNNLVAILIGFFLIVIVTVLFFFKSSLSDKKQSGSAINQTQEEMDDFKKYTSINSTELFKQINNKENFEILDIRDEESFLIGHIVDSQNITPENLIQNISSFDKNKQYYIIDDLGLTPAEKELMGILSEAGFKKVSYLEGGIYNWANELYPIVEFGNPNSLSDQAKVNYIASDNLNKLIAEEGNNLIIVDLRNNSDYTAGHLKNAMNIPLENLETRRKEIPSYKRIILYDDTGIFAFQGAVRLFDTGVLNVFALSDGFRSWKEKGFEVVK